MTGGGVATVARQEFRLRIRAGRWKLLLAAWVGLLLVVTLLLRLVVGQLEEVAARGTVVYGGLVLLVLGLSLLVVPALSAQSVNGDRERGTLAVLQVTRLSPAEIVLGKFAAAWGTALVFLALSLPFVVFAMALGGVAAGRVLAVTAVIALLLGVVCAIALWLSTVLQRTTTSGVLAYLSVSGLCVGTLIAFGLATALTAEQGTESFDSVTCTADTDYQEIQYDEVGRLVQPLPEGCTSTVESYPTSISRTDRTWWLLAPNPFVVLADAAPALPEPGPEATSQELDEFYDAQSLDVLGQLGSSIGDLRLPPSETAAADFSTEPVEAPGGTAVWPYGLAFDVALAAVLLWLTVRRLRTPTRSLPRGQRVA